MKESIQYIIDQKCSLSRFGDGEIDLIYGSGNGFQLKNDKLALRLKEVAFSNLDKHEVAIPGIFDGLSNMKKPSQLFWLGHFFKRPTAWFVFKHKKFILNALSTRFYMSLQDKSKTREYIDLWKLVWNNRDIVFIEGEQSRLGYKNDLFDNTHSIERILCPCENAFDKYDEIFAETIKLSKDKLLLLALGQTATVLAHDLALRGYQAIDIGHIDIEYEWFRMGALEKVPIENKYVNEVGSRETTVVSDVAYFTQVIAQIK